MIAPPSEDPLMALPAAETQPQNEQPLASVALPASADDIKLVNEMFMNQTVTTDLLKRELKARQLCVSAKNKDTLVARLAAAIRSAGPDGNVQQCSTVVATKTELSKRKVDTDTEDHDAAKRQQLMPADQNSQQNQHQPLQPASEDADSASAIIDDQAREQVQAFLQHQAQLQQRAPRFVVVPSGLAPYQQFTCPEPHNGPMITLIVPVSGPC